MQYNLKSAKQFFQEYKNDFPDKNEELNIIRKTTT